MIAIHFHRQDQHFLSTWWRTIDRLTLVAIFLLIAFSALMTATASPSVAERIGLEPYFFIRKQLIYLVLAFIVIIFTSFLSPTMIRRIGIIGFLFGIALLIIVLLVGVEVKGAKRWLYIGFLTIQPSEFIKPFFAITTAWILSLGIYKPHFPRFRIAISLFLLIALLLILQPDFGMTLTIALTWGAQLFLAGMSIFWVLGTAISGVIGFILAYSFLPHVTKRVNSFLDPASHENYQVKRSLEAFMNGGLYGKGPGEGTVKQVLPDSHTDFIFAVAGEELGALLCLVVIGIFAFILLRGFTRMTQEQEPFALLGATGILMQFGTQSLINIGVTLHLLPTKGMTLPFVSYGGSSMLASALAMGMALGLTRRRYGMVKQKRLTTTSSLQHSHYGLNNSHLK
jgi:cell division protein FtsW